MPEITFLEKLKLSPEGSFHVLEPAKAKRMKAGTMYIPSPLDVARAIAAIPEGETRTLMELRRALAATGKAETACPFITSRYWKWLAYAYDEAVKEPPFTVPWWRVLKDGKPGKLLPGGIERQTELLEQEGVRLKK
jgi:hypothetical protein